MAMTPISVNGILDLSSTDTNLLSPTSDVLVNTVWTVPVGKYAIVNAAASLLTFQTIFTSGIYNFHFMVEFLGATHGGEFSGNSAVIHSAPRNGIVLTAGQQAIVYSQFSWNSYTNSLNQKVRWTINGFLEDI
jgi:hypothetical protein